MWDPSKPKTQEVEPERCLCRWRCISCPQALQGEKNPTFQQSGGGTSFYTATMWGQKRLEAMKAMDKAYDLADLPASVFSMADFQKFKKSCESFLWHYGWLAAKDAMKQKLCRYSITQKHPHACMQVHTAVQVLGPKDDLVLWT